MVSAISWCTSSEVVKFVSGDSRRICVQQMCEKDNFLKLLFKRFIRLLVALIEVRTQTRGPISWIPKIESVFTQ